MAKEKEAEVIEKIAEEKEEQAVENTENVENTEEVVEEPEEILNPKLQKKRENREAKAERKAKNQMEEKKKRPSNLLIAILIFGVLIGMFAFIWGYNYYHKEASIQSYIKNNGGKSAYSNMDMGDGSVLSVTAKKNDMKVLVEVTTDNVKKSKKYYKNDGKDFIEYVAAYYLQTIKPETRAFTAKANCVIKINGEKFKTYEVKYRDAEDIVEEYTEKMSAESEDSAE